MKNSEFYSKIIIYRSRQIFLGLMMFAMTAFFAFILVKNYDSGYPWYVLALPFSALGLAFLIVPMTEEWEYKPWQSKPRRIEQQER
ncbi:MAG: hypothetical protein EOP10_13285 [Proteobacteria bacterium]|nr:MAG: hypothetical protein EOP10_13285 [Pseudomonadota bacterium]